MLADFPTDAKEIPPDEEFKQTVRAVFREVAAQPDPPSSAPPPTKAYESFPSGILPPSLRNLVRDGAKALGCDEAQIALPALAACSAAIGNSRCIALRGSWSEPAVIWGAGILPSGTIKSPAMDLALDPIRRAQHIEIKKYQQDMVEHAEAKAQWEAQKKNLRGAEPVPPVCRRLSVSDLTMEALALKLAENPRGLLCERDELAGWFGAMNQYRKGGADEAHWLASHGARALTVDRKTGENRLIYVPRAFVALIGTIQPGTLRRALTAEYRESGLAARMLLAMPPPKPRRWTEAVLREEVKERYAAMMGALLALPMGGDEDDPEPIHVPLDAAAKKIFIKFYDEHNAAEQASEGGDIAAAWAKLEGYAARLALIVHLVRGASGEAVGDAVDRPSTMTGIMLARWFGGEAERVYAMLGGGAEDANAALARFIFERGGQITARELARGNRKYSAPGAAREALCVLAEAGYGRWRMPPPGETGGRPSEVFALTKPPAKGIADSADNDKTPAGAIENEGIGIVGAVGASKSASFVGAPDDDREAGL